MDGYCSIIGSQHISMLGQDNQYIHKAHENTTGYNNIHMGVDRKTIVCDSKQFES